MSSSATLQEAVFEEVAESVFVADLLPRNFCNEVLREFQDSQQWCTAKIAISKKNDSGLDEIIGVVDVTQRHACRINFRDLDMLDKTKTAEYLSFVQAKVGAYVSTEFGLNFNEFGDAEIVRYPQGGMFKPHTDTNRDNPHRAFTVIIYLNDDFSGGETSFPDLNYDCRPKAGRVLVFLSTQLHAGLPVIKGEKNIIVFWGFFPGSTRTKNINTS
jgi:hypothetical protein